MLEMILFAIAVILIGKLISILGTTDEDEVFYKGSLFGERLKDVTPADIKYRKEAENLWLKKISKYLKNPSDQQVLNNLQMLSVKLAEFDCEKFIQGASGVFKLFAQDLTKIEDAQLKELVDKGFIEELKARTEEYKDIPTRNFLELSSKIVEVYFFGHKAYIKIAFTVPSQNQNLIEEYWTFNKTLNSSDHKYKWYLTNIELA